MYHTQLYIDTSKLVTKFPQELTEILSCHICLGLAIEPCECGGCENIFCSQQINMMKDKICPICKGTSFKPFDNLHKAYKTLFRTLQLKCDVCDSVVDYKQYMSHITKCNKSQEPKVVVPQLIFYNFFFESDEQHIQYEPLDIVSMNLNLRASVPQFQLGKYAIDLAKHTQTNIKTNYQRQIVQEKDNSHIEQSYWIVERKNNPNEPYEYELQVGIETAYQEWLDSKKSMANAQFIFGIEDNNYCINFSLMTQTNLESKYSRTVRRVVI